LVTDYFGSIALVWIAFLVLPRSKKFPTLLEKSSGLRRSDEDESLYCFCLRGVLSRGGRLGPLLRYDVVCFVFSFIVTSSIYFVHERTLINGDVYARGDLEKLARGRYLRAKAAVYWCQVVYSLFSLPFAFFVIPVVSRLLTHATFTGFNPQGACVEFAFPVRNNDDNESGKEE